MAQEKNGAIIVATSAVVEHIANEWTARTKTNPLVDNSVKFFDDLAHSTKGANPLVYGKHYINIGKNIYGTKVEYTNPDKRAGQICALLVGGDGERFRPGGVDQTTKPRGCIFGDVSMIAQTITARISMGFSTDNIILHVRNVKQYEAIADELCSEESFRKYGFRIPQGNILIKDTSSYPEGVYEIVKFAISKFGKDKVVIVANGDGYFAHSECLSISEEYALQAIAEGLAETVALGAPAVDAKIAKSLGHLCIGKNNAIEKPAFEKAVEMTDNNSAFLDLAREASGIKSDEARRDFIDNRVEELVKEGKTLYIANSAVYVISHPEAFIARIDDGLKNAGMVMNGDFGTEDLIKFAQMSAGYMPPMAGFYDLGTHESIRAAFEVIKKMNGVDLITTPGGNALIGLASKSKYLLSSYCRGCTFRCCDDQVAINAFGLRNMLVSTAYSKERSMPIAIVGDIGGLAAIKTAAPLIDNAKPGDVYVIHADCASQCPQPKIIKLEEQNRIGLLDSGAAKDAATIIICDGKPHKCSYALYWQARKGDDGESRYEINVVYVPANVSQEASKS